METWRIVSKACWLLEALQTDPGTGNSTEVWWQKDGLYQMVSNWLWYFIPPLLDVFEARKCELIAAMSKKMIRVTSAKFIEAFATKEGLQYGIQWGLHKVIAGSRLNRCHEFNMHSTPRLLGCRLNSRGCKKLLEIFHKMLALPHQKIRHRSSTINLHSMQCLLKI